MSTRKRQKGGCTLCRGSVTVANALETDFGVCLIDVAPLRAIIAERRMTAVRIVVRIIPDHNQVLIVAGGESEMPPNSPPMPLGAELDANPTLPSGVEARRALEGRIPLFPDKKTDITPMIMRPFPVK
jgi:hypothetical protein